MCKVNPWSIFRVKETLNIQLNINVKILLTYGPCIDLWYVGSFRGSTFRTSLQNLWTGIFWLASSTCREDHRYILWVFLCGSKPRNLIDSWNFYSLNCCDRCARRSIGRPTVHGSLHSSTLCQTPLMILSTPTIDGASLNLWSVSPLVGGYFYRFFCCHLT